MNYGHHGRDLLLELKRTRANDHKASSSSSSSMVVVPPYNDRLVRECLQDLQLHVQALQDQVDAQQGEKPSMNVRPSLVLQNAAIGRNKRCLLAYHKIRADRLMAAYWNNSLSLDEVTAATSTSTNATRTTGATTTKNSNLSPAEEEFYASYEQICRDYATMLRLPNPDLRSYGNHPPQPLSKVQVQVLRSTEGPIVLESGATLTFQKGALHYLAYSDVEGLLRDGTVALLSTEEEDDLHQATTGGRS